MRIDRVPYWEQGIAYHIGNKIIFTDGKIYQLMEVKDPRNGADMHAFVCIEDMEEKRK